VDVPGEIKIVEKIVEQDTRHDKAVTNFLAQENRANGKRQGVEVYKRERNNEMVCICDHGNRCQDQYEWQPRRSIGSQFLPQTGQQWNPFESTAQLRRPRFSD